MLRLDSRVKDLTGQRFTKLVAIKPHSSDSGGVKWLCKCDCGNEAITRGSNLKNGLTKSCGCYNKESHTKHGYEKTPTYTSWRQMKDRCDNPNHHAYKRYGGRGITYQTSWKEFTEFIKDMGERPKNRTLDRIDNDKGYSKNNCRWATKREQAQNRDDGSIITYKGKSLLLYEWADRFGMNRSTFYNRRANGWTMEEIENTPVVSRRSRK